MERIDPRAAGREPLSVGVVLVAYRSAATIDAALRSILRDPQVVSVVVQDNSSDAETEEIVAMLGDARVSYVASANVGFSKGCNAGAEHLGSVSWLAFVNPDVELDQPLSRLAEQVRGSGATLGGAEVVNLRTQDAMSCRPAATPVREIASAIAGSRVYGLSRHRFGDAPRLVGQVSGALILISRANFLRLGGFDERFELYYDDVDLCVRATALDGCWFTPEPWGSHIGGVSAASSDGTAHIASRVSRIRYLRKHFKAQAWVAVPLAIALDWLSRSVTRQPEGALVRARAVRSQLAEVLRPGSVSCLK